MRPRVRHSDPASRLYQAGFPTPALKQPRDDACRRLRLFSLATPLLLSGCHTLPTALDPLSLPWQREIQPGELQARVAAGRLYTLALQAALLSGIFVA